MTLLSHNLWCHPEGAALEGSSHRDCFHLLGHAHICKLDQAILLQQQIGAFDITVNYALSMQVSESCRQGQVTNIQCHLACLKAQLADSCPAPQAEPEGGCHDIISPYTALGWPHILGLHTHDKFTCKQLPCIRTYDWLIQRAKPANQGRYGPPLQQHECAGRDIAQIRREQPRQSGICIIETVQDRDQAV